MMPAGTITALRTQAHDPQRVNVFINDAFALGVSVTTITREGLYVGKVLSEDDYARLEQTEGANKTMQAALRFLEARPRSTAEVRERLQRKGFHSEEIDQALTRLHELQLVDDMAFARFWVENRQAHRPRGAGALRDELRRKGVDRAVIDAVLDDQTLVGEDDQRAWELARAALPKYAGATDRQTFTRRLSSYLQRRGFGFDTIRPIIDRLWEETRGAGAEDAAEEADYHSLE